MIYFSESFVSVCTSKFKTKIALLTATLFLIDLLFIGDTDADIGSFNFLSTLFKYSCSN